MLHASPDTSSEPFNSGREVILDIDQTSDLSIALAPDTGKRKITFTMTRIAFLRLLRQAEEEGVSPSLTAYGHLLGVQRNLVHFMARSLDKMGLITLRRSSTGRILPRFTPEGREWLTAAETLVRLERRGQRGATKWKLSGLPIV